MFVEVKLTKISSVSNWIQTCFIKQDYKSDREAFRRCKTQYTQVQWMKPNIKFLAAVLKMWDFCSCRCLNTWQLTELWAAVAKWFRSNALHVYITRGRPRVLYMVVTPLSITPCAHNKSWLNKYYNIGKCSYTHISHLFKLGSNGSKINANNALHHNTVHYGIPCNEIIASKEGNIVSFLRSKSVVMKNSMYILTFVVKSSYQITSFSMCWNLFDSLAGRANCVLWALVLNNTDVLK